MHIVYKKDIYLFIALLITFVSYSLDMKAQDDFNRRVILIGISEYTNVNALENPANDALAFKEILEQNKSDEFNPIEMPLYIFTKFGNSKVIMNKLEDIVELSNEGDEIVFFFSGHGLIEKNNESTDKDDNYYLLLREYENSSKNYSSNDVIDIYQLEKQIMIAIYKEVRFILIIDACYSGVLKNPATKELSKDDYYFKILSSTENQESSDMKSMPHSFFSYFLLNGLKGQADTEDFNDNKITYEEIEAYVKKKILRMKNYIPNISQIPEFDFEKTSDTFITYTDEDKIESSRLDSILSVVIINHDTSMIEANLIIKTPKDSVKKPKDENSDLKKLFYDSLLNNHLIGNDSSAYELFRNKIISIDDSVFVKEAKIYLLGELLNDVQSEMNIILLGYYDFDGIESDSTLHFSYSLNGEEYQVVLGKLEKAQELINNKEDRLFAQLEAQKYLFQSFNKSYYNDLEQKKGLLLKALDNDNDLAVCYNRLGEIEFSEESYDDAEFYFNKAMESEPRWIYPKINMGQLNLALGNEIKADSIFKDILDDNPKSSYAFGKIGETYLYQGNTNLASEYLKKAIDMQSDDNNNSVSLRNLNSFAYLEGITIEKNQDFDLDENFSLSSVELSDIDSLLIAIGVDVEEPPERVGYMASSQINSYRNLLLSASESMENGNYKEAQRYIERALLIIEDSNLSDDDKVLYKQHYEDILQSDFSEVHELLDTLSNMSLLDPNFQEQGYIFVIDNSYDSGIEQFIKNELEQFVDKLPLYNFFAAYSYGWNCSINNIVNLKLIIDENEKDDIKDKISNVDIVESSALIEAGEQVSNLLDELRSMKSDRYKDVYFHVVFLTASEPNCSGSLQDFDSLLISINNTSHTQAYIEYFNQEDMKVYPILKGNELLDTHSYFEGLTDLLKTVYLVEPINFPYTLFRPEYYEIEFEVISGINLPNPNSGEPCLGFSEDAKYYVTIENSEEVFWRSGGDDEENVHSRSNPNFIINLGEDERIARFNVYNGQKYIVRANHFVNNIEKPCWAGIYGIVNPFESLPNELTVIKVFKEIPWNTILSFEKTERIVNLSSGDSKLEVRIKATPVR
jgi:tetratricopeptide (TPR) repeat protein